ncbi:MAG TPA: sigma-70 family RNA polymerase sigma factor [Sedimentisphaerales bacterium]|nr:sigma-70 family RNA polymerase sigma factor [Sedimentisphaerales bacterium]
MNYSKRAELFRQLRTKHAGFVASVLWKLTGDRELFTEAMQYALLGMWQNIEKLKGRKAPAYIYRIVLTANSRAWRDRIGRNGHFNKNQLDIQESPDEKLDRSELVKMVRRAISNLPARQSKAIVMRYLEQQDYGNIAAQLCCTQASARSHVSKVIATLKGKLAALAEQE